jgi:hypothetical protein
MLFGDDLTDFCYEIEIDQVSINLIRDIPQNNIFVLKNNRIIILLSFADEALILK